MTEQQPKTIGSTRSNAPSVGASPAETIVNFPSANPNSSLNNGGMQGILPPPDSVGSFQAENTSNTERVINSKIGNIDFKIKQSNEEIKAIEDGSGADIVTRGYEWLIGYSKQLGKEAHHIEAQNNLTAQYKSELESLSAKLSENKISDVEAGEALKSLHDKYEGATALNTERAQIAALRDGYNSAAGAKGTAALVGTFVAIPLVVAGGEIALGVGSLGATGTTGLSATTGGAGTTGTLLLSRAAPLGSKTLSAMKSVSSNILSVGQKVVSSIYRFATHPKIYKPVLAGGGFGATTTIAADLISGESVKKSINDGAVAFAEWGSASVLAGPLAPLKNMKVLQPVIGGNKLLNVGKEIVGIGLPVAVAKEVVVHPILNPTQTWNDPIGRTLENISIVPATAVSVGAFSKILSFLPLKITRNFVKNLTGNNIAKPVTPVPAVPGPSPSAPPASPAPVGQSTPLPPTTTSPSPTTVVPSNPPITITPPTFPKTVVPSQKLSTQTRTHPGRRTIWPPKSAYDGDGNPIRQSNPTTTRNTPPQNNTPTSVPAASKANTTQRTNAANTNNPQVLQTNAPQAQKATSNKPSDHTANTTSATPHSSAAPHPSPDTPPRNANSPKVTPRVDTPDTSGDTPFVPEEKLRDIMRFKRKSGGPKNATKGDERSPRKTNPYKRDKRIRIDDD